MTPATALTTGFSQWLEEVAGSAAPSHRVQQGQPLSPFGTSMRVTKSIPGSLAAIESGRRLSGDEAQKVVDLRFAALLEGTPARLSPLGEQVLAAWRRLGVANGHDQYEVVRSTVLCRLALKAGIDSYRDYMRFWIRLRALRPAADWFADPGNLVLVSYLNRHDSRDYNPFLALTGLDQGFPTYVDWQAWAQQMPVPAGWVGSRLQHIVDRVDGLRTRSTGLRAFCQAMEAVYLAIDRPRALVTQAAVLATP